MYAPKPVYNDLLKLVWDKDYFVLTTNVDHCFQKAGFDKLRLFYTQGDYGLWQCSKPCHQKTYDNEAVVKKMLDEQKDMKIPSELVPHCPVCGAPMSMNLRADMTFVEDEGWHKATRRYENFLRHHEGQHILFWELGVGGNTPVYIQTLCTIFERVHKVKKYPQDHQIPVLADDCGKSQGGLCLRELRGSLCTQGYSGAVCLYRWGYREGTRTIMRQPIQLLRLTTGFIVSIVSNSG